jgi:5'-phosphate synthase pdxT subunit
VPVDGKRCIGVLALQGDIAEHERALAHLPVTVRRVKLPDDLIGLDGLIIPGGESTAIGKLMRRFGLLEPVRERVRSGLPVYGTCAGMILLSNEIHHPAPDQPSVGGMDVAVERNAFGSQINSFETDIPIPVLGEALFHGVFIRAPAIRNVGPGVEVLARLADNTPVAARQRHMLVSSFHPELTDDGRMHRLFLDMVESSARVNPAAAGA